MDFAAPPLLRASFVERINRFLVRCELEGVGLVDAQMPNSGRLAELLLPGALVRLVDESQAWPGGSAPGGTTRKTRYTAWAVDREDETIFIHTHQTNSVVRTLLDQKRIPGLETSTVVRSEARHGSSRFDFLLEEERGRFFLEVKSVTLFGNGAALFPDAVTARGRRHLEELGELGAEAERRGAPRPVVLFLVHSARVDRFLPDYHTDFAFARTFLDVRNHVRLVPVSVAWTPTLELEGPLRRLSIPWEFIERETRDTGAYVLLLRLAEMRTLRVGKLGRIDLQPGWYAYVGSAMQHLSARIARHLRKRKRFHWHVDFLRDAALECRALPLRSSHRRECELAEALSSCLEPVAPGFGCSDCRCRTHLFFSPTSPSSLHRFYTVLEPFRMPRMVD